MMKNQPGHPSYNATNEPTSLRTPSPNHLQQNPRARQQQLQNRQQGLGGNANGAAMGMQQQQAVVMQQALQGAASAGTYVYQMPNQHGHQVLVPQAAAHMAAAAMNPHMQPPAGFATSNATVLPTGVQLHTINPIASGLSAVAPQQMFPQMHQPSYPYLQANGALQQVQTNPGAPGFLPDVRAGSASPSYHISTPSPSPAQVSSLQNPDEVTALRAEVQELKKENQSLKQAVAQLQNYVLVQEKQQQVVALQQQHQMQQQAAAFQAHHQQQQHFLQQQMNLPNRI